MKKKRVLTVASVVHLIFWIIVMLVSVVQRFTYRAPEKEPLDFFLSRGVYNVFILVAAVGIVNATVLFFSLRAVSRCPNGEHRRKRSAALWLSVAATVLFYLSAVLIFLVRSDAVVVVPIVWLLCELCCSVLLLIPQRQ